MGKFEDAAEIFKKASNQYKVAQDWEDAGKAFARAAECYVTLEQNLDAATSYVDAANCYKKVYRFSLCFLISFLFSRPISRRPSSTSRRPLASIATWASSPLPPSWRRISPSCARLSTKMRSAFSIIRRYAVSPPDSPRTRPPTTTTARIPSLLPTSAWSRLPISLLLLRSISFVYFLIG